MPIIDYHNHLPPEEISCNVNFSNLTKIWFKGDHYKWAATVPYTQRNLLYHWTHLELQRYFGINEILNPSTEKDIFARTEAMLQSSDSSVQNLIKKMNIDVLCTTDDHANHIQLAGKKLNFKTLPSWCPNKAMNTRNPIASFEYINKLGVATNIEIKTIDVLLTALQDRHDFFASVRCKISDHGIEEFYAEDFTHS